MIRQLVAGQEAVVKTARSIFPVVDKAGDEPTRRPADPAHADPREKRLDAAQPARKAEAGSNPGRRADALPPRSFPTKARSMT